MDFDVRVLLTNDDGFFAQGMAVLKSIVSKMFPEVWISAPEKDCSGMSRAININSPIEVRRINEREFAVGGTPVDSAILGLRTVYKITGSYPDMVFSGVNRGSNVGSNVLYSGTIAAASTSASLGIPSFAVSQEYYGDEVSWENTEKVLPDVVEKIICDKRWNRHSVINVNIPHSEIIGTLFKEQGEYSPCDTIIESAGKDENHTVYLVRDTSKSIPSNGPEKSCRDLLREGYIIITPLGSDLTDYDTLGVFLNS
ncbi:MAG: 5'/3'-nucleotidase SurE [Aaplasma endosymbiont of Hyalomma asiaticum]